MDNSKFIKIMMLTTSDQDGEALSAIRTANAMLKRENLNWEQVLKAPSQPVKAPGGPAQRHDPFDDVFGDIFAGVGAGFGGLNMEEILRAASRMRRSNQERPKPKHWTGNFTRGELVSLIGRLIVQAQADDDPFAVEQLQLIQQRINRQGNMTQTQDMQLQGMIRRWGTPDDRRKLEV